jgi:hypothetical protein
MIKLNNRKNERQLNHTKFFFTHLSFPFLVAGLEASDEDDDGDDDRGHDGSRGRNDDVVQLLATADTLCSDLTALFVWYVVRIDGNIF